MSSVNDKIKSNLIRSAILIKKYNLGDEQLLCNKLPHIDGLLIEMAWSNAHKRVRHEEIIKNSSYSFSVDEQAEIASRVSDFKKDNFKLYGFLLSNIDKKSLKLMDENTERRIRFLLAKEYLQELIDETLELKLEKENNVIAFLIRQIIEYKFVFLTVIIIAVFGGSKVIDGLTLPNKLLKKYLHDEYGFAKNSNIDVNSIALYLYEEKKYKFNGAHCYDGWVSHSQGRGTCSHHGGVYKYFYKGKPKMSLEECRIEASKIIESLQEKARRNSWRD